jgi:Ca-activated chloride channel family protein
VSPIVPLRAIYPKEGTLYADHPYVILKAPWVDEAERAAAAAFLSYLISPDVQTRFEQAGFRDHDGRPGSEITDANGLNPLEPRSRLSLPDGPVLERMQRSWSELRKRAHLIVAIDVSRPMGEPISPGGETKLALAKEAATAALEKLEVDDDVGIWVFGEGASGNQFRELAPIAPLASRREQLATLIAGLATSNEGNTPLYATIRASVRDLGERFDRKRINAVMLLTTGRDGDPRDTELQVLLRELRSQNEERFVRVFPMTYGSTSTDAMTLVAKASRGAGYTATDSKTIGRVITNILSNF